MSEEKKPASKVSIIKSKTSVDDRGHGSEEYLKLEAESQTDEGAWELFEKLSAHTSASKARDKE